MLTGTNTGNSLALVSANTITDDANADVAITNNASFTGTAITLGDQAGNTDNFGSLTFNSTGAVAISEDSATDLTGTNTGNSLALVSTGAITDQANTDITITNNATFTGTSITLQDNGTDSLSVGGTADFEGGAGAITVAAAGTVNFGALTFNTTAGAVNITEDSGTSLAATNTANTLNLTSAGAITDTGTVTVAGTSTISTGAFAITLDSAGNDFQGTVNVSNSGANAVRIDDANDMTIGTVNVGSTLTLNIDRGGDDASTLDLSSATITAPGGITLDGQGTNDSLLATNTPNLWTITGTNSGTFDDNDGAGQVYTFTDFANLTGNANNDRFNFTTGNVTGAVDGFAGGTNALDYTGHAGTVTVTLTAATGDTFSGTATEIGSGFTNINTLVGSGNSGSGTAGDSLTSTISTDTTVNVNNAADDTLTTAGQTLTFSNMENLTTAGGNDTFNINEAHTGNLDAGDGDNEININAALAGNITSGTGADTINSSAAGTITGNIDAGAGDNEIDLNATLTGNLNTGSGNDTITTVAVTGSITDTGGTNTIDVTGTLTGNLNTGSGNDTITTVAVGGSITDTGGTNTIDVTGTLTGNLNTGSGNDTITTAAVGGSITDTGGTNTIDVTGTLTGNLNTGSGNDTITTAAVGGSITDTGGTNTIDVTGTLTGNLNTGSGNDTITTVAVGGSITDTGGTNTITLNGTLTGNLSTGGGNDTITTSAVTGNITDSGGDNTYVINGALTGSSFSTGAGNDTITFNAGATSTAIDTGAGNDTFNFDGGSVAGTLTGGADVNSYIFTNGTNGTVTSSITIAGNDIWQHVDGVSLGTQITGAADTSLRITNPAGQTTAANLTVVNDTTGLKLPTLTGFTGLLVIGGNMIDQTTLPASYDPNGTTAQTDRLQGYPQKGGVDNNYLNADTVVDINTDTLRIDTPIVTGGTIALLAQDIELNNDITTGATDPVIMLALSTAAGRGKITAVANPTTITSAGSIFVLTNTFVNSDTNLILNNVNSGADTIQTVVGQGQATPSFNDTNGAQSIASTTDTNDFIAANSVNINAISVVNQSLSGLVQSKLSRQAVLAGNLIGLQQLAFVDVSLFEQDLDLFGTIGQGIALALEQCEELEGCAVNEEELALFIDALKARIAELERRLKSPEYSGEHKKDQELLDGYNEQLEKFGGYMEQLQAYNTASQEAEQGGDEFSDEFGATTIEAQIKNLSQVLEVAKQRIDSLEQLKANADERDKLSKSTGIELTIEALDEIIKATNREIQFIESQIKQLQDSNQASLERQNGSLFWAESGDQRQARKLQYGPAMFNQDDQVLAIQALATGESWY